MYQELTRYLERYFKKTQEFLETALYGLFRCTMVISNRRRIKNYFKLQKVRKLHLGCGKNILKGWLNTDLKLDKEVVFLDAAKKLSFDDCTFDYVFSEHLIEHLKYQNGARLIQESYRILKNGGKLRISTPDLFFLIKLYTENKTDLQKQYVRWTVDSFLPKIGIYSDTFVINNFFRDCNRKFIDHKFIYDYKALKDILQKCGFVNVSRYRPGESDDDNLQGIEAHGRIITDEFNELESLVVEGTK